MPRGNAGWALPSLTYFALSALTAGRKTEVADSNATTRWCGPSADPESMNLVGTRKWRAVDVAFWVGWVKVSVIALT